MADVKDPVAALLDRDEHREDMLRNLGQSLNNLAEVTDEYKAAWKAAVGVGWLKADLARVGFVDPTKLPRLTGSPRAQTPTVKHAPSPSEMDDK